MKNLLVAVILGAFLSSGFAKWPPLVEPNSQLYVTEGRSNTIDNIQSSKTSLSITTLGDWAAISKNKIPGFQKYSKNGFIVFAHTEEDQLTLKALSDTAVRLKGQKVNITIETYGYMSRGGILLLDLAGSRVSINAAEQDWMRRHWQSPVKN